MITDETLSKQGPFPKNGKYGVPLGWVIDNNLLYTLSLEEENALLFLDIKNIEDITLESENTAGITLKITDSNDSITIFQTSEYFGSILLSSPTVVNLLKHNRGWMAFPPAQFINNSFVFNDERDNNEMPEWFKNNYKEECDGIMCGCKK